MSNSKSVVPRQYKPYWWVVKPFGGLPGTNMRITRGAWQFRESLCSLLKIDRSLLYRRLKTAEAMQMMGVLPNDMQSLMRYLIDEKFRLARAEHILAVTSEFSDKLETVH